MNTNVQNSLKKDVVYNYMSTVVVMLLPLIAVKYYLINFGGQNWGVVSFAILIQIFLGAFDAGMSQVLVREFSLTSNFSLSKFLISKMERIYFFIVVFVCFLVYAFRRYLVEEWMRLDFDVGVFVVMAGLALFVVQIYGTLYKSFLVGAGFQRISAAINAGQVVLLHVVGVFISFYFVNIYIYFVWMVISSVVGMLLRRFFVFRELSIFNDPVNLSAEDLKKKYYGFLKVSISVSFGVALTHLDKIIVGALLELDVFGYYMVAASLAIGVVQFVYPVGQSFFPYLVAEKDNKVSFLKILKKYFLINCGLSVVGATVFFVFGQDIIDGWLGEKGRDVYPIIALMVVGTALAPIGEVFYTVWLVFGRAEYIFIRNIVSVVFVVFGLKYFIYKYGFCASGAGWVFTNIFTLLVGVWSFFVFKRAGLICRGGLK